MLKTVLAQMAIAVFTLFPATEGQNATVKDVDVP